MDLVAQPRCAQLTACNLKLYQMLDIDLNQLFAARKEPDHVRLSCYVISLANGTNTHFLKPPTHTAVKPSIVFYGI